MKKGEADLDSVDDFFDSDTCEISMNFLFPPSATAERLGNVAHTRASLCMHGAQVTHTPTSPEQNVTVPPSLPAARLTDRAEDSDITGVFEEEPTPQPYAHMSPADHSPGLERTFMGGDADAGSDGITPVPSPAPAAIAIANDSDDDDDDDVMPVETLRSSPKRLASPMKNASPKSRTKVR